VVAITSYLNDDEQLIATLPPLSACASSTGRRAKQSVRNVVLHSIIRVRRRLRRRNRLTAQERANLRASRPRATIVTASLGVHPWAPNKRVEARG
jgi:hypothetical protein